MKYKLINTKTKEEHLCNKITIDGFDYYVSGEIIKDVRQYKGKWQIEKGYILNKFPTYLTDLSDCRLITATTNPNIDIPKVVDRVERLALEYENSFADSANGTESIDFKEGYNKSQETRSFSEEDMIEFAEWCQKPCLEDLRQPNVVYISSGNFYWYKHKKYTPKELLQFWKEQQTKIVYYE